MLASLLHASSIHVLIATLLLSIISLRHLRNTFPALLERTAPQRAHLLLQPKSRARPVGSL